MELRYDYAHRDKTMAVFPSPQAGGKKSKHLGRAIGIDMTPMVDLGFLFITFFIFTTSISEPTSMPLNMPKKGAPIDVPESKTLNIIVGKQNKIIAYEGMWPHGAGLMQTDLKEVGNIVRNKQQVIEKQQQGNSSEMVVIIKPLKTASYGGLVGVLDEMIINRVRLYAVVDPMPEEEIYAGEL